MSSVIFGPVPSRRYGRSLGIDLVPMKTCDFNCTFCQLGPTPHTTLERKVYIPLEQVYSELKAWLAKGEPIDILTLCGSGEPTLHSRFGEVLDFIASETNYPSLLMSNGSLFFDADVRRAASKASRVKVSLHSWDQDSFEKIVRPNVGLSFDAIFDGYRAFRQEFRGEMDIEVFIVPGVNNETWQLNRILEEIKQIKPDTVTVNTAVRPPADASVKAIAPERLRQLQALFRVVVAPKVAPEHAPMTEPYSKEALLELYARHPLTDAQFAQYFGQPEVVIAAALADVRKECV